MCKAMEDMRLEKAKEIALKFLELLPLGKITIEDIVNVTGLTLDQVKNLHS